MATVNLTNRQIEAARKKAREMATSVTLWDDQLKGFGCLVSSTGRVSWLLKKRLGEGGRLAKQVKQTFGNYEVMPLDDARARAIELISEIGKGVDLGNQKRQVRRAQHKIYQSGKLGDVVATYLKKKSKPGSYWKEIKRKFDVDVIPYLGKETIIAHITKNDIRGLIDKKEEAGKGAARYLFAVLRPFFKWCVERDLIPTSSMEDLASPKVLDSRDRILCDLEVKSLWTAISGLSYPWEPFYKLLLLTGQRREEVSGMKWEEIDRTKSTWTIPKNRTKNGKEHIVHLSALAIEVINSIPMKQSQFVFTTTGKSSISGYGKAKARIDKLSGIEMPWRIHDLRRTAASGMARLSFMPHVIERVLNHVSGANGGLVAVYQRYDYLSERKRAIEAWGNYVEALVSGAPKIDNVVPLRA